MSARPVSLAGRLKSGLALLALAAGCGLIVANPLADAAGFPPVTDRYESTPVLLRLMTGVAAFFMVLTGLPFVVRAISALVGRLAVSEARPPLAVAVTLIVCGTLSILGAVMLAPGGSPTPTPLFQLDPGQIQAMQGVGAGGVVRMQLDPSAYGVSWQGGSGGSLLRGLVALLALLTGAMMASVGVWASMPAPKVDIEGLSAHSPHLLTKPEPIPEA